MYALAVPRQAHVEKFFKDICPVNDVVVLEIAVSSLHKWDVLGNTSFDFLTQLCGLVPLECYRAVDQAADVGMLARTVLYDATLLARVAARGEQHSAASPWGWTKFWRALNYGEVATRSRILHAARATCRIHATAPR